MDGHEQSRQEGTNVEQLRSPYDLTGVLSRAFSVRETWKRPCTAVLPDGQQACQEFQCRNTHRSSYQAPCCKVNGCQRRHLHLHRERCCRRRWCRRLWFYRMDGRQIQKMLSSAVRRRRSFFQNRLRLTDFRQSIRRNRYQR